MNTFSKTIGSDILFSGVGLHTGKKVNMRLVPSKSGTGIKFVRTDLSTRPYIPALAFTRGSTVLCTELKHPCGARITTVEHILAALYAFGITDLIIEMDGEEVPVLDGSSKLYTDALSQVDLKYLDTKKDILVLDHTVRVTQGNSWAILEPCKEFRVTVEIDFAHPIIGRKAFSTRVNASEFTTQISHARTFAQLKDVEYIRSQGLGKGGNLENTVIVGEDGVINPEGLRFKDEFVRHKALDAIGDISLLGMGLCAHYRAYKPGHSLNALAVDTLLTHFKQRPGAQSLQEALSYAA